MIGPRSLRLRLMLAMAAVFGLALLAAGTLDRGDTASRPAAWLPAALAREPYQDGLVLLAFGVPALALIWLVSSWSLAPLARASAAARRIGPAAPDLRLPQAGLPQEIAPLIAAVNGALDRMAGAIAAERAFTENAAHELRTPLAVLKLRLQRGQASATAPDWAAIGHDLAQMQRLVSQLLDLARKQHAGRAAPPQPTDLARLAREAAGAILPLAEQAGRPLLVDLPETLPLLGHADDLRDALTNLLENALIHGAGPIDLHGARTETALCITVRDAGPGFAAALRQAPFQRFAKGAASTGCGLGLAIVQEVARMHGGHAELGVGPGGCVRLILP